MATHLERKHTLATRWMHWINFPLLAMMMWSGLLIYWSYQAYSINIFGFHIFAFFPDGWLDSIGLSFR
ncbi:MAG TPA: hypothetical protein PKA82_03060, partial [Pyrinomonadaceae bacterium]|nr:hypothetical protein [Pyrinomonadaceae bacterium]